MVAATGVRGARPQEAAADLALAGTDPPEHREAMLKKDLRLPAYAAGSAGNGSALPDKPLAAPLKPRKLLCWGRHWTHMANAFTEETVKILGRKTGAFEVVATDDPQLLLPERLQNFDAIFLNSLHDRCPSCRPG